MSLTCANLSKHPRQTTWLHRCSGTTLAHTSVGTEKSKLSIRPQALQRCLMSGATTARVTAIGAHSIVRNASGVRRRRLSGYDPQGKGLHVRQRFIDGAPVGHDARHLDDVRYPAAIVLALELDANAHARFDAQATAGQRFAAESGSVGAARRRVPGVHLLTHKVQMAGDQCKRGEHGPRDGPCH